MYEPHDAITGNRLVRRAILSIARKNGKTALIAALALAHLVGPEEIMNGEIYSAANDREQAGQVFKVAAQIVRAEPELADVLRVVESTKTIACYGNGSFYRAVSAETGTKHGFNPSVVIYDELAQARNRDLYDVLDTSFGARSEPLFITISTQSNDPEHILSKLIDDGLYSGDPTICCRLYAAPEDADIFDPAAWRAANPALGDFRSLEDFKALADKVARMPAEEPKFRNLFLNQRVSPLSSFLARAEWLACAGEASIPDGAPVYLALDLSSVRDLTALIMVSDADPTVVVPFLWKPEDYLEEHSNRDFGGGSNRYGQWARDGHLLTTPGKTIDREVIARHVAELCGRYDVKGMAFDRWGMRYLLKEFDRIEFPAYKETADGKLRDHTTGHYASPDDGLRMVDWGQGFQDMSPALDALERAVTDRTLIHGNNPVLTWNIANAVARMDPAGGRKLDKDKSHFRIDGAVALAMAVGLKMRDRVLRDAFDVEGMIG